MRRARPVLARLWVVLVIAPVVAVGSLVIYRFHGVFGAADTTAGATGGTGAGRGS